MLTVESPTRRRWLMLLAIFAVGLTAFAHNWMVDQHLTFVTSVQSPDHPIHTPLQRIRPGFTADVDMWIRYALALLEGEEGPRSHHTNVDNAPTGREVHWNSALTWWIAGLGWSWHKISGTPLSAAVERVAVWANLPLLLAFAAGFGWWTSRRAGALAGVIVTVAVFGHRSIYEGFMPAYPDHHGLIAAGILGLMLGALFMGGGWTRGAATIPGLALLPDDETSARRAAAWAGFWGAFGMWISMASLAIPIALVAFAGVLATLASHRSLTEAGARFHSTVWRTWGRVGALTSVAFYLLEYFPSHLGWRLEVNHPLYALAWWGGAELTASLLEFFTAAPKDRKPKGAALARCAAWALPAALAPALVILWRGVAVFAPLDPFMTRLHDTIWEFKPLLVRLRVEGFAVRFDYIFVYPVLYVAAGLLLITSRRPARQTIWLTFTPVVMLVALSFVQIRWILSAGSAEIPLLLACLALAFARPTFGATSRRRVLTACLAAAFFYLPSTFVLLRDQYRNLRNHLLDVDEILAVTHREIAQTIRDSQPAGPVVVLASPNASLALGYFGRFQTLGTFYWENSDGLKTAAELYSAPTELAFAQIIRRLGITHIVTITQENYVLSYAQLLHPERDTDAHLATYGFRLFGRNIIPIWLEPVLYRTPRNLPGKLAGLEATIYKVNFAQTRIQANYRLAQLLALQEKYDDALASYAAVAQLSDRDAAPWLRRGEIFIRQKRWREATENFDRGIAITQGGVCYKLLTQAGLAFDQAGEIATALAYYRRAIAGPMTDASALHNLARRLATTVITELQNPAEALRCAERATASSPENAGYLDTLSAALAANQRFPEAVATAERAIALAEKAGDKVTAAAARQHLAAYQARHPWRE